MSAAMHTWESIVESCDTGTAKPLPPGLPLAVAEVAEVGAEETMEIVAAGAPASSS